MTGSERARPTFLRDGEEWGGNPFKCRRTQNMCDSCSRDCGCKTNNCSWNFVCYGQNRKGKNGCRCKMDSDCESGRCDKWLQCREKVANGGGCLEDDDCESRRCSKGLRCYDQLENGQGCFEDDDCKSGRCANNFKCKGKAKNGEGCMADDDCESLKCEAWGWTLGMTGTCRKGGCTKDIPFMATNVELHYDGQETYFNFYSDTFENEFNFFKDVKFCPDAGTGVAYRIYGTKVSIQDFQKEVEKFLKDTKYKKGDKEGKPIYDHVIYAVHGFQNDPKNSFDQGYDFLTKYAQNPITKEVIDNHAGYLTIPICWRNKWGVYLASYDYDRNNFAPVAGKALASAFDVFDAPYKESLVTHSQGNYVLRIMAQNIPGPKRKQVFENIFMVAADARSDMFSSDFNPAAPRDDAKMLSLGLKEGAGNDLDGQVYLELPADETKPNGGYDITLLTKHIHVLYNKGDFWALKFREAFQIPCLMCDKHEFRNALGRYGDRAEGMMTLPYFKERVTFHDFTHKAGDPHGYVWEEAAVNLYKAEKTPKNATLGMELVVE